MPPTPHIRSYYVASANPLPAYVPLAEEVDCDVCVVGAGIAGCCTALHLAERGYRVVILEQKRVGWAASGRSGGQVLPGYGCGQEKLVNLMGRDTARALWDLSIEGVSLVRQLIERHRIECDWVSGHLQAAVKSRHTRELLAERDSLAADYGYRSLRFVDQPELRELLATGRYVSGLYDSNAGHLHPLNYTLGLAEAATRQGARFYEGTRATGFEGRSPIRVLTQHPGASVRCRHLILCGNTQLQDAAPPLARRIMSIGTYIVATRPLGEDRARQLIANNMAVSDLNWILDYFRRSADHRLLFGGRVSYSGLSSGNTSAATRARMLNVFPQLAGADIEYSWGGYIDITMNRAPDFGRLAPEVYYLQGFSGHGLALAGIGGKLVAEAVAGTAERFDLFARIPHREFPGGALLRRPALVLAMLYYRLRDLL